MKTCLSTAILLFFACFVIAEEKQNDDSRKYAQRLGETLQYLNAKKIPKVRLINFGIQDVCKYLNEINKDKGFCASFYINVPFTKKKEFERLKKIIEDKKINVLFKDISMLDLIKTVSLYFNVDYEINPEGVRFYLGRMPSLCGGMNTILYKIPPQRFKNISVLPKSLNNPDDVLAYDASKGQLFIRSERWSFLRAIQRLLIATGFIE
jgi:hypothetical protein